MIQGFRNEIWESYSNENWSEEDEYMVSNYGRIKKKKVYQKAWRLSPTSLVCNYESFGVIKKGKGKSPQVYVHRLVAMLFLEKREDQKFVIHLDFDKLNNEASNLKWVNKRDLFLPHRKNSKKSLELEKSLIQN